MAREYHYITINGNTTTDVLEHCYLSNFLTNIRNKTNNEFNTFKQQCRDNSYGQKWLKGVRYTYTLPTSIFATTSGWWASSGGDYGWMHYRLHTKMNNTIVKMYFLHKTSYTATTNEEGYTDVNPGPNILSEAGVMVEKEGDPTTRRNVKGGAWWTTMIFKIRVEGNNLRVYTNVINAYCEFQFNKGRSVYQKTDANGICVIPNYLVGDANGTLRARGVDIFGWSATFLIYDMDNGAEPWVDYFNDKSLVDHFTYVEATKVGNGVKFKTFTSNCWVYTGCVEERTNTSFGLYSSRKSWHRELNRIGYTTAPNTDRIRLRIKTSDGAASLSRVVLSIRPH